jgi:hypothetical protein
MSSYSYLFFLMPRLLRDGVGVVLLHTTIVLILYIFVLIPRLLKDGAGFLKPQGYTGW